MTITIRLGARLRAARKAAGFKRAKDFAKKHKVAESTYSQHESGARTPDDDMLKFYSNVFDVNFNWLKTGIGQPYSRISSAKKNTISEELMDLKQEKNTLSIDQELLAKILEELLEDSHSLSTRTIAKKAVKNYIKLVKYSL